MLSRDGFVRKANFTAGVSADIDRLFAEEQLIYCLAAFFDYDFHRNLENIKIQESAKNLSQMKYADKFSRLFSV